MPDGQRQTRTILVIDDSEVVLEMTRFTLEMAGFRVLTRDRAAGSIAAILHDRPDLVLLDVNMPHMSGDSIADVLSRTGPTRTLVILYSGLPEHVLRIKARATGAHGFIQKKGVQVDLVRQIRAFLKHADSSDEAGASSARMRAALALTDPPVESVSLDPPSSGFQPISSRQPSSSPVVPAMTSVPPATGTGVSAPPTPRQSGTQRLVTLPTTLFLDDDISILTGYRRAFQSDELIGEYLTSAEQALRRLSAAEPPDVVVTDLVLPGMNGIDLYRRALVLDATWRHRFVFVTGAMSIHYVAEFLRGVGGRALEKPVDMRRLRDAIRYSATGARIFRKQSADG